MSPEERGHVLLTLARGAIEASFGRADVPDPDDAWFHAPGATFVTLTKHGKLHGCIGTIEAHRPLVHDVRSNARAAAFRDPRSSPLRVEELAIVRVEVSLLSPLSPMPFRSEEEAKRAARPGVDGLVIRAGHHRGTFLPQVWEKLPNVEDFFAELKMKAGLSPSYWSGDVAIDRFTVDKWSEP